MSAIERFHCILNEKRHVTSALKYMFLVLVSIKCKFFVAQKAFENNMLYMKQASLWRWNGFGCWRFLFFSGCCCCGCSLQSTAYLSFTNVSYGFEAACSEEKYIFWAKKTRDFCFEIYIFGFSNYKVYVLCRPASFWALPVYITPASIWRWNCLWRWRCFSFNDFCCSGCSLQSTASLLVFYLT